MRVRAAGVNPVDAYIRSGTYARKPPLPYTPGTDGAGEVEAVGADVKGFKAGDRVYIAGDNVDGAGAGTYAEQALCAPTQLHRAARPRDRSPRARRSACRTARRTARSFSARNAQAGRDRARPRRDAAASASRAVRARARARHDASSAPAAPNAACRPCASTAPTSSSTTATPNYLDDDHAARPAARGVDVVLEMAAHINLDKDLGAARAHGRVVVIGNRGRVEIDPRGRRWARTPRSSA